MIEKWLTLNKEFAADLKIFQAYWLSGGILFEQGGKFVILIHRSGQYHTGYKK